MTTLSKLGCHLCDKSEDIIICRYLLPYVCDIVISQIATMYLTEEKWPLRKGNEPIIVRT